MYGRGIFVKKNGFWVETTPRVADHTNPLAGTVGNAIPVTITITGGSGGNGGNGGLAGYQGYVITGTANLKYSDVLTISVGDAGADGGTGAGAAGGHGGHNNLGFNGGQGGASGSGGTGGAGGGGGGATIVAINKHLWAVAAGGGGGAGGGSNSRGQPATLSYNGLEYGSAGHDKTSGGEVTSGGGGGKIICTKLYELGRLPEDIYKLDQEFGARLVEKYPLVYNGYRAWAEVVVDWMSGEGPQMMFWIRDAEERKQAQIAWSTRWAEDIATPWANWMANRNSRTGLALMIIGTPISTAVGLWQRIVGPSKKPAGFIKGLALIGVFTALRGVVSIGKMLGK